MTGQLPPGCIQCPRCGYVGNPVAHGRDTSTAVAAGLLLNPLLGLATLALKRGELACPSCGLKMGNAKVFSIYKHADAAAPPPQQHQHGQQPAQWVPTQASAPAPQAKASLVSVSGLATALLFALACAAGACLFSRAAGSDDQPPTAPAAVAPASEPSPAAEPAEPARGEVDGGRRRRHHRRRH